LTSATNKYVNKREMASVLSDSSAHVQLLVNTNLSDQSRDIYEAAFRQLSMNLECDSLIKIGLHTFSCPNIIEAVSKPTNSQISLGGNRIENSIRARTIAHSCDGPVLTAFNALFFDRRSRPNVIILLADGSYDHDCHFESHNEKKNIFNMFGSSGISNPFDLAKRFRDDKIPIFVLLSESRDWTEIPRNYKVLAKFSGGSVVKIARRDPTYLAERIYDIISNVCRSQIECPQSSFNLWQIFCFFTRQELRYENHLKSGREDHHAREDRPTFLGVLYAFILLGMISLMETLFD